MLMWKSLQRQFSCAHGGIFVWKFSRELAFLSHDAYSPPWQKFIYLCCCCWKSAFFVFFSIHVLRILSKIFALYGAPFQSNKTSSQKIYDFIFSESHIWQLKQGWHIKTGEKWGPSFTIDYSVTLGGAARWCDVAHLITNHKRVFWGKRYKWSHQIADTSLPSSVRRPFEGSCAMAPRVDRLQNPRERARFESPDLDQSCLSRGLQSSHNFLWWHRQMATGVGFTPHYDPL